MEREADEVRIIGGLCPEPEGKGQGGEESEQMRG
jgi:hypothetical protein